MGYRIKRKRCLCSIPHHIYFNVFELEISLDTQYQLYRQYFYFSKPQISNISFRGFIKASDMKKFCNHASLKHHKQAKIECANNGTPVKCLENVNIDSGNK